MYITKYVVTKCLGKYLVLGHIMPPFRLFSWGVKLTIHVLILNFGMGGVRLLLPLHAYM
jgi:hypothetical protein